MSYLVMDYPWQPQLFWHGWHGNQGKHGHGHWQLFGGCDVGLFRDVVGSVGWVAGVVDGVVGWVVGKVAGVDGVDVGGGWIVTVLVHNGTKSSMNSHRWVE